MDAQILRGRFWKARKIENVYILNINEGVSIITGLTHFIMDQKIIAGKISGAGIVDHMVINFFNPYKKHNEHGEFFSQNKIINILGSFFLTQGELKLLLDVILKKENHTTLSGMLLEATISGMNSFFIFPVGSLPLRQHFPDTQTWN